MPASEITAADAVVHRCNEPRIAHGSFSHGASQPREKRRVAENETHHEKAVRFACRRQHEVAVFDRGRQRFLTDNVLARAYRLKRDLGVGVVGSRNHHDVDVSILDQRGCGGGAGFDAQSLRRVCEPRRVGIRERNDIGAVREPFAEIFAKCPQSP